jgi:ketosteroid isomerase-like protein
MKRLLLSLLLFFTFCTVFAQDKQAILNVLETQRQAWNRGDVDGFMQGYWKSDSLMFVGKTAPVYGWQTTLDNYKKHYPDKAAMGQLAFTVIKLDLLDPQNAFMLGGWHLTRTSGDIGGYFTLWFRKIGGEWKVVCDHTSSSS